MEIDIQNLIKKKTILMFFLFNIIFSLVFVNGISLQKDEFLENSNLNQIKNLEKNNLNNNLNDKTQIVVFYGQGCPHCSKLDEFLKEIEKKYNNLEIKYFELYYNKSNLKVVEDFSKRYNHKIKGVPTLFINDRVISGFSLDKAQEIEEQIIFCSKNNCYNPSFFEFNKTLKNTDIKKQTKKEFKTITILSVIGASLVDAINPCAFAVLIVLLTSILATKEKKKALFCGLSFSLSIFISYFLMGFGLYSALNLTSFTKQIYLFFGIFAIILGIFNIKDFFWYGKGFLMEVPRSWRPKLKSIIYKITSVYGAFFIGFVISLFLLPCTSGPYIVILGMLANHSTKFQATLLLLLYNLIFIIPMILITLFVYFGFAKTEKLEKLRQSKLQTLHLIAGIILITLGLFICFL